MARTIRGLLLACLLVGCAASGAGAASGGPHRGSASRGVEEAAPPPAPQVAMACAADQVRFCPPRGCTEAYPGYERTAPVSVTTPEPGGALGRFCSGSDCRAALFRDIRERGGAWSAEIWTGENWTRPEGELTIAPSRAYFELNKPASDGGLVWRGLCQPAGS